MELRHLRYFVAAAELEHFGRAAARLAIVQPALSKQIRELEEEVGTPLFERLRRGVRLTAAGRGLLEDGRLVLGAVEAAAQRARDVGAGRVGKLRIGFVDTAIYHAVLPRIFREFRQQQPDVELELVQQPSVVQGELLRKGELDAGFVFHPPEQLPGLGRHFVATDPIVFAVPAVHRYARRREVGLAELREESFVWIRRTTSPRYYDAIHEACARLGFAPRIVQDGGTDAAMLSLVAAGAGVSFCVASAARRKPESVVLVRIRDLRLTMRLEAVWRTDHGNPALPTFLALVRAVTRGRKS